MRARKIILILASLAAAAGMSACGSGPDHHLTTDVRISQSVRVLSLSTRAGTVNVRTGDIRTIDIHRTVDYQSTQPPQTRQEVNDGVLALATDCSDCGTSYDLTIPASVALVVNDGAGNITINGTAASISVDDAAGAVNATGLHSPSALIRDRAGAVTLAFASAPASVTVRSAAGDVTVTVPAGSYRLTASTPSGTSDINVPSVPSAHRMLNLASNAGDVTVNRSLAQPRPTPRFGTRVIT